MTGRDRVLKALSFDTTDRIAVDLGGMRSTGISAFAYPKLVAALGLPPRLPRVHDTGQMLALPDADVLDALGADIAVVEADSLTNAFDEPERWHAYDFNGRLPARVMKPEAFETLPDGTIRQNRQSLMVPASFVFDSPHAGQAVDLSAEVPREDLDALQAQLEAARFTDERVRSIRDYCRRVRVSTTRAVFFGGFSVALGYRGGIPNFSMLYFMDPDYVHRLHRLLLDHFEKQAKALLPAIAPYVDVIMLSADDQGLQTGSILPPALFRDLFVPYYREANDLVHILAPGVRTFLHCCGGVYDLLDDIVACGFDAFNPVQWSAGGHSFREWKSKCRRRIALWGGGVNTQVTLPLGTLADVRREVQEVVACLSKDSGYVFCAIHNILAEIPPEKVLAMYRTVASVPSSG
jgi:uroporphyrinogen decarboxylase